MILCMMYRIGSGVIYRECLFSIYVYINLQSLVQPDDNDGNCESDEESEDESVSQ